MTSRLEMPAVPVRRRRETPWIQRLMVFLTLVVLADSLFGERGFAARARFQRAFVESRQQLAAVQDENAGLREQIRRLQSDPDAIEAVAREELGLIRPGELLVIVNGAR
jgi:cell division protein FtsB